MSKDIKSIKFEGVEDGQTTRLELRPMDGGQHVLLMVTTELTRGGAAIGLPISIADARLIGEMLRTMGVDMQVAQWRKEEAEQTAAMVEAAAELSKESEAEAEFLYEGEVTT